jgi:hypothetical protein
MISINNNTPWVKLICCFLLFVAVSQADTVTLTLNSNFPGGYIRYDYLGADGSAYFEYAAPYQTILTDTDGTFNNTPVFAICYDIHNDTNVGTAFTGHFENRTGTPYLEATYLVNLLNLSGDLGAPLSTQGAISLAIWQIMWPSSNDSNGQPFLPGAYDPAAQAYITQAAAAVAGGYWTPADAAIYPTWVPDDPSIQRFGIIVITPEPRALPLLGCGLLGLAMLWRRHLAGLRRR